MKHQSRIAPVKPIHDCRHEARRERTGAADPNFTNAGVGEEGDVPDALPQLVKRRMAADQHGASEFGQGDAVRIALEETYAEGVL
jgi:hypothetical protein